MGLGRSFIIRRGDMNGDDLLKFEEENYEWLVEKLIKREQEAWLALVEDEFNKSQQGREDLL